MSSSSQYSFYLALSRSRSCRAPGSELEVWRGYAYPVPSRRTGVRTRDMVMADGIGTSNDRPTAP